MGNSGLRSALFNTYHISINTKDFLQPFLSLKGSIWHFYVYFGHGTPYNIHICEAKKTRPQINNNTNNKC